MKFTVCFILFILSSQVLSESQSSKNLNDEFHLINENLRNISSLFISKLDDYHEHLKSMFQNVPKLLAILPNLRYILKKYKSIDLQYLEDLKSCDDIKLRYASFFIKNNKFELVEYDENAGKI